METISNESKANEIANAFFIENVSAENEQVIREMLNKAAFEAMQWKEEQFKNAINEIKANIIESRDNKEYYETNRKTTLNWILRLIDECCESISIQKENKL